MNNSSCITTATFRTVNCQPSCSAMVEWLQVYIPFFSRAR